MKGEGKKEPWGVRGGERRWRRKVSEEGGTLNRSKVEKKRRKGLKRGKRDKGRKWEEEGEEGGKKRKEGDRKKNWGPCLKVKVTPVFLSLCLPRFLSLGAVKIMDCHAKWPDTRGQRGCLGGRAGKEGVIVGGGGRRAVWIDRGADRPTSRVRFQVNLFLIIKEHRQKQHERLIIILIRRFFISFAFQLCAPFWFREMTFRKR